MSSSVNFRERLIEEVKKYPVLYDTNHEQHRDIDMRDRCWREISKKLGDNSETLKREWKSLRDSMRQAIKKTSKCVTTKAGLPCKKWRYQSRMEFLMPFMTNRRHIRHTFSRKEIKLDDTENQSEAEQEQQECNTWEPAGAEEALALPYGATEDDALDLFFASICQSTKRLPKKYQNQVKRQFLDVLLRVEEECETDSKEEVYKNF